MAFDSACYTHIGRYYILYYYIRDVFCETFFFSYIHHLSLDVHK